MADVINDDVGEAESFIKTADERSSERDNKQQSNSTFKQSYENPNYRKLYAKLSMKQMIMANPGHDNDDDDDHNYNSNVNDDNKAEIRNNSNQLSTTTANDNNPFAYEDDDDGEDSLDNDDDDDDEDDYDDDDVHSDNDLRRNLLAKDQQQPQPKHQPPPQEDLPDGWERHEDELGPYFWHIPTGTIQRERPYLNTIDKSMIRSDSLVFLDKSAINLDDYNPSDSIEEENEHTNNNDGDEHRQQTKSLINRKKIIANMKLTFPTDDEDDNDDEDEDDDDDGDKYRKDQSFIVHSLGWLDVDETKINSKTGSSIIKHCIYELTTRAENAVHCWGPNDTQSLILKINHERILLQEPISSTTLSIQLIQEIRMWAIDDNNNFAYIVKDRKNGKPGTVKCHIFHCDDDAGDGQQLQQPQDGRQQPFPDGADHLGTPQKSAQRLALHLKDVLVRIKNSQQQQQHQQTNRNRRPNDLLLSSSADSNSNSNHFINHYEFPTPIEEPKKSIQALYIGFIPVSKPMGVDILNMAIDEIVSNLKMSLTNDQSDEHELMRPVIVNISPSNIIVECKETGSTLVECRVRYLSFLGISLDNVKRCGFIMQVNDKEFVCHCFEVFDESSGPFCKIIEAACKLRYQKCLDAHSAKFSSNKHNHSNHQQPQYHGPQTPSSQSSIQQQLSPVTSVIKSSISGVFSKILKSTSSK